MTFTTRSKRGATRYEIRERVGCLPVMWVFPNSADNRVVVRQAIREAALSGGTAEDKRKDLRDRIDGISGASYCTPRHFHR